MPRKRKRDKKKGSDVKKIDWSLNPETIRETSAVVFIILGLLFVLSIFNLAGRVGLFFAEALDSIFGITGYLMPFVFVGLGIVLWNPDKYHIRPSSYIGLGLCFIFVPALISPHGGAIGQGVSSVFQNLIGSLASYVVLAGLSVVAVLVAFNTSVKSLMNKLSPEPENNSNVAIHGALTPTVSVFATMKNKMGLGMSRPQESAPVVKAVLSHKDTNWEFPPLDLLENSTTKATSGNITKNVEVIQKTLKDFNIEVSMGDVNVGPTVTQYTLKPKEGIKLNQITARSNDLSLALAAHPLRIEAPIPGKSAVGVEVPNKIPAIVTLREMLETKEFKSCSDKSNLSIALGRDVAGNPIVIDLKRMPHLLVAGSTGSGKSIGLHSMALGFVYQNSPADLRLLIIDPKRVEFTNYNGVPHLLAPVVTEVDKAINVLRWALTEMDRRFRLFAETSRRDITSYNQNPPDGKLPYIVIIIDELADLMAQASNEIEAAIVRLSQMARATGIHLIVATQRPSVDVITGLIKANITSRIAFAVASQIDSRTIIDQGGSEKLLGKGDMLYVGAEFGKPRRVQGPMVQEKETKAVTDFLKRKGQAIYDDSVINYQPARRGMGSIGDVDDDLFEEAKAIVVQAGKASASLLQRRLRVGYARAARLLDILEEQGLIGPSDGAKPRDVLMDPNELDRAGSEQTNNPPSRPNGY